MSTSRNHRGTIVEPPRSGAGPYKTTRIGDRGFAAPIPIIILIKGGARRICAPAPWSRGVPLISIIRGPLGPRPPPLARAWAPLSELRASGRAGNCIAMDVFFLAGSFPAPLVLRARARGGLSAPRSPPPARRARADRGRWRRPRGGRRRWGRDPRLPHGLADGHLHCVRLDPVLVSGRVVIVPAPPQKSNLRKQFAPV